MQDEVCGPTQVTTHTLKPGLSLPRTRPSARSFSHRDTVDGKRTPLCLGHGLALAPMREEESCPW